MTHYAITVRWRHDGRGNCSEFYRGDLQSPTSRHARGPACEVVQGMPVPSTDNKLIADEARRKMQHGAVKAQVEDDINAEIAERATQAPPPGDARKLERVAGTFRENAVAEVVDTEREVHRSRGAARVSQVIDYAFFLVYALLAVRFVLALIAARSNSGFVQFIVTVTTPFYAPFEGIVGSPKTGEGHTLLLPVLVALGAYGLLHLAINRLLRLLAVRKTEI